MKKKERKKMSGGCGILGQQGLREGENQLLMKLLNLSMKQRKEAENSVFSTGPPGTVFSRDGAF